MAFETIISAVFDENMLATSFAADVITLADPFATVTGAINYDVLSRTLSITPESPLALLRPYTAKLSSAITDLSGQSLISSPWSFSTRDGVWGTPQLIESDNLGNAGISQIALDPTGNGLAVWRQFDGTRYNIWANRFE